MSRLLSFIFQMTYIMNGRLFNVSENKAYIELTKDLHLGLKVVFSQIWILKIPYILDPIYLARF